MAEKKEQLNNEKKSFRISLAAQVAFFFLFATLVTGITSYFALRYITDQSFRQEKQKYSQQIANDLSMDLMMYPSLSYLWNYWIENADQLDVEYDFTEKTMVKEMELGIRYPGFVCSEATVADIAKLSDADKKVFAEVMYTTVIDEFNSLALIHDVDYVYAVGTTKDFSECVFIFSGADSFTPRSSTYGDAYTLGTRQSIRPDQAKALGQALKEEKALLVDDQSLDSYIYQGPSGDWYCYIGVTYRLERHLEDVKSTTREGVINFIMMQIALSVICLVLLFFFTIRPVRRIQKRVRAYKMTKESDTILRHLIRIHSGNELGELKDDICECVMEIEDYIKEIHDITTEQERIRTELSVAAKIQSDMLPKNFPDRKEFDLYATMTPAKEVGGDFYDFFLVDEDHLALVIADVSGKGVPAALFMVIAKTLIRNRTMMGGGPAEILGSVNDQLCEGNETGLFVTVWMGILEISTGRGVAANAGHEHPVLRRKGGAFEMVKYRHSPAVATMEGLKFREHDFQLEPGDRLYVYTDGVPEATNRNEELFGEERTLAALNKAPEAPLPELLAGVKQEIDGFAGDAEQFDDITMLALDYYGKE